ncbi:hypothetical protein N8647_01740, partial [bacterium]|nr:hypothetical protein [bacterium]
VPDGKVTRVQRGGVLLTIIIKSSHGSLEKAHATVIPAGVDALNQVGDTRKICLVPLIWLDHEFRRFPEGDLSLKIPDNESDGFSVEPIGGVPNQSGPREGTSMDDLGSGRHKEEVEAGDTELKKWVA